MSTPSRPGWANLEGLLPQSPSILLVEDDVRTAAVLQRAVEKLGCTCKIAESAEVADRWVGAEHFDLILLDITLPYLNGIEFLHWVLGKSPTTAVIMVTGNDDIEMAIECMEAGARTYLVKPVDFDVLRVAVRDALAMRTLLEFYRSRGGDG